MNIDKKIFQKLLFCSLKSNFFFEHPIFLEMTMWMPTLYLLEALETRQMSLYVVFPLENPLCVWILRSYLKSFKLYLHLVCSNKSIRNGLFCVTQIKCCLLYFDVFIVKDKNIQVVMLRFNLLYFFPLFLFLYY